jgi:hypothetical protein
VSLWNLGNDFISSVREVAYLSEVAVGVDRGTKLRSGNTSASSSANGAPSLGSPPPPPPLLIFSANGSLVYNGTAAALAAAANSSAGPLLLDLHANRFWLYVRDNAPAALYEGYLNVINTVVRTPVCPCKRAAARLSVEVAERGGGGGEGGMPLGPVIAHGHRMGPKRACNVLR